LSKQRILSERKAAPTEVLVVLPTYNERENRAAVIASVRHLGHDVLVVDDASPDGTGELADELFTLEIKGLAAALPGCVEVWGPAPVGFELSRVDPEDAARAVREKVGFLQLCKNPALCAEVMITAVKRLGVDAAIIFSESSFAEIPGAASASKACKRREPNSS